MHESHRILKFILTLNLECGLVHAGKASWLGTRTLIEDMMAKRRSSRTTPDGSARTAPARNGASLLERLAADEARAVLQRLLATRPDLRAEVELIASGVLSEVSFESVADDLEHTIRSLDLGDLGSRAGRHHGGYTSPSEAAWELLQEATDPLLEDMKRRSELALEVEALEICKGLLLGLYRVRGTQGDEFLGWAPDFPEETAAHALGILAKREGMKRTGQARHARPHFDEQFVEKHIPDWSALVARALKGA